MLECIDEVKKYQINITFALDSDFCDTQEVNTDYQSAQQVDWLRYSAVSFCLTIFNIISASEYIFRCAIRKDIFTVPVSAVRGRCNCQSPNTTR